MKFEYQVETLANKLQVISVPMQVPTVTVLVMVRVGSRQEEAKINGISHFVEHLVFKGTKKYPSALAVASAVDSVGAEFNAFTSKEYTGFYVKAASEHVGLALDILGQFMFAPLLKPQDIKRERGVIIEEINMYEDNPMRRVGDIFDQLMFAGHPLGWDVIGTKETVGRVKHGDFVGHMGKWYQPGNMVLGIAGDAQEVKSQKSKVKSLIEKYFGTGTRSTKSTTGTRWGEDRFVAVQTKPQVKIIYKKTEQAHFCLGVRSLSRGHKDRYVAAVLSTILGGNMSSRLFTEVREKRGLAYYVRSGIEVFHETGHLMTQAGVTINKIEEAIEAVIREYQKISKAGSVTQDELQKAKDYLKGKLLIDLEDSFDVASVFAEPLLLEGKVRTPEEAVAGVEKVTSEDVARLAKEIFTGDRLNLAVIGPYKESEKFEKILQS